MMIHEKSQTPKSTVRFNSHEMSARVKAMERKSVSVCQGLGRGACWEENVSSTVSGSKG